MLVCVISDLTMKPMGSSMVPLNPNSIAYLHDHYPITQDETLLGKVEVILRSNFYEEFDYPIQGKAAALHENASPKKILKIPRKNLRKIENPVLPGLEIEISVSTLTVVSDKKLLNPN